MSIDAWIVKSASKPLSKKKLNDLKVDRSKPEGKLDKNGKTRKFSRDFESDWTIKNDKAYYGLKEHAVVDAKTGLVLTTVLSRASVHDTKYIYLSHAIHPNLFFQSFMPVRGLLVNLIGLFYA